MLPLSWNHFEPMICEDLNKMIDSNIKLKDHKVAKLKWIIETDNGGNISIIINFKHPYLLAQDAPKHTCFLNQARIQYEKHIETQSDSFIFQSSINIYGWNLFIEDLVPFTIKNPPLFSELETEVDTNKLNKLENEINQDLKRYKTNQSFHIQDDFSTNNGETMLKEISAQWLAAASARPLFIFDKPVEISSHQLGEISFIERVSNKWWSNIPSEHSKDYYLALDNNNEARWIYQDSRGKWFIHGQFN